MKNVLKISFVAVVMFFATGNAFTQETGDATANIVEALVVTWNNTTPLDFGDIIPSTGGTVTIASDAGGARSSSGAVSLVGNAGGSAEFDITGTAGATVDITVESPITLTETVGGVETMSATTSASSATATLTAGSATVYVGGVLTVGNGQLAGQYDGTFDVTVAYQ